MGGDYRKLLGILLLLFLHRVAADESLPDASTAGNVDGRNASGEKDDRSPSLPPQSPSPSPPPPPLPLVTDPKENSNTSASSSDDQAQDKANPPPPGTDESMGIIHPPPEGEEEDPGHCCGVKVHACLSSPGDSSDGMLSLVVKSRDVVNVKVIAPSFWSADPSELSTTADGKEIQVKIEMVDPEAAKQQPSSKIIVTSDVETCELPIPGPSYNPGGYGDDQKALLVGVRTPVVGLSMLALAIVLGMGFWAFYRYRETRKRQPPEEPRYVELEMGVPATADRHDKVAGVGSEGEDEDDESWEVWDEEWNPNEAVGSSSFKMSESLSGKGLAARRSAKEGRAD